MKSSKPKKSPQEQEHDLSLKLLTSLGKKARALWSFGQLKTNKELYELFGQDYYGYSEEQLNQKPSIKDVYDLQGKLSRSVQLKFQENNSTNISETKATEHTYENYYFNPGGGENGIPIVGNIERGKGATLRPENVLGNVNGTPQLFTISEQQKTHNKKTEERILTSPKQVAKLIGFQNRAACSLLDGITIKKKRCQLLRAATGAGKTYIIAAVLRQLMDMRFPDFYNNIAIWPIVWITRATIVEQTRRVCEQQFGLESMGEVLVVNIEQMRSKFGELFLKEEIIISQGEEHVKWNWHPKNGPLIFVIDESHLAKNEDSSQSKIIQSLSEIDKPIFVICVSATPFCRVKEARYFCVNTHKELMAY